MKTLKLFFVCFLAFFMFAGIAGAVTPPNSNIVSDEAGGWIVSPTGVYPDDLENAQWAVNNVPSSGPAKKVKLLGGIPHNWKDPDFEGKNRLYVTKNVIIEGEGKENTVIDNGCIAVGTDGEKLPIAPGTDLSIVETRLLNGWTGPNPYKPSEIISFGAAPSHWTGEYGLNPSAVLGYLFYRAYKPDFTCRDLQLKESLAGSFIIGAAHNVTITGVKINDTRFFQANGWWKGKNPLRNTFGVVMGSGVLAPFYGLQAMWEFKLSDFNPALPPVAIKNIDPINSPLAPYMRLAMLAVGIPQYSIPAAITGNVNISNNEIFDVGLSGQSGDHGLDPDCSSDPLSESTTSALQLMMCNAEMAVSGNTIENVYKYPQTIPPAPIFPIFARGIRIQDNMYYKNTGIKTLVQGNTVKNVAIEAILVQHQMSPAGVEIKDNAVITGDEGHGIVLEGIAFGPLLTPGDCALEGNDISLVGGTGILLRGGTENNTIKNNKITGSGDYGIMLTGDASNNTFLGNNLTGLVVPPPHTTPPGALYYFGASACNNTVKGYTGGNNSYVIEETPGCNDITGVK